MSLCARGKRAFRHGGGATDRRRRRLFARYGRRDDAGFGIIEAVVAVALLALIIAPITRLVVSTESASNDMHLRAEAADLATQALETAQYQTANGVSPTAGVTSSTQYSGGDPFTVSLDWELAVGTGSSNVCIASPGQPSSRIWTLKATVNWGKVGSQEGSLSLTTLVSPALADLADTNAAEIAVPIFNSDDSTLETTVPINVNVVGSCGGSQCSGETIPGNEKTTETANSGSTGCAVFTDLFAGIGWTYTVTVNPPSPYVDPSELSAAGTAPGLPVRNNVAVQPNTVTVVNNPNIILSPGSLQTIDFNTVNFGSGSNDPSVHPAPYLPITVESSTLLCSVIAANTCVLGNATAAGGFSYAAPQVALLYPGPTVAGTTPNYSIWAGDQADSSPTYQAPSTGTPVYGTDLPTTFQSLASGSGTLNVSVYPLVLNVTLGSGHGTVSSLTAADVSGGDTFTLNGTSGTVSTGLPLGQFVISATGTGNVSFNLYVWIFPTGVCSSSSVISLPCTPSTSTIPVTVG